MNFRVTSEASADIASSVGIAGRYQAIRGETERLAAPLSAEDQQVQSMPDASPAKWHRAHTTWFFEEFVLKRDPDYRPFHPQFSFLFNSYYEAIGARHPRPQRGLLTRPDEREIGEYRAHADAAMLSLLRAGIDAQSRALVELGLHHEQQHQELLLTDILHAFAQNPLSPVYRPLMAAPVSPAAGETMSAYDGGLIETGHDGEGFAFDNEGPRHRVFLEPYRLAGGLVSNAQWLEFIEAGGYRTAQHWLADGWAVAQAEGFCAPLHWRLVDGQWFQMTLSGLIPLELEAPVCHVSFYEADAFARWRGMRLPTEAEWELAAAGEAAGGGNWRESGLLRPAAGGRQFFGDVWEWTQSPYTPYPGFRAPSGAVGEYNGKFMVNQLVLRGGSCVTPRDHMRLTYRNFFYPHQRWQFMGLRLAEDARRPPQRRQMATQGLLQDVLHGLGGDQKTLPSKYFYDEAGSALFEAICELPEYYPTRTETQMLRQIAPALAARIAPGTVLVEFGSGASLKTRLLLDAIPAISVYVPVEINAAWLARCAAAIKADYPALTVTPLAADFTAPLHLPAALAGIPALGFFPGSTIGNLEPADAIGFLRGAREGLGSDGRLLIGIDLLKDVQTLIAAYDDSLGVTAEFNKNILVRINRELEADFDPALFDHEARWNEEAMRIEMHLRARKAHAVTVAGQRFGFAQGESVHSENSHKYTVGGFTEMAAAAGWRIAQVWRAPPGFAVLLLE